MTDGPHASPSPHSGWIRDEQNVWGGLALIVLAAIYYFAAGDLGGMKGFAFGPGTAPRLFASLLAVFGVIVMVTGFITDGPRVGRYDIVSPTLFFFSYLIFTSFSSTATRIIASACFILALAWGIYGIAGSRRDVVRGPLAISISLIFFAAAIRPLGLVVSSFIMFAIAAAASKETRWIESLIAAAGLTAFCTLLFVFALGLPFQLWPTF